MATFCLVARASARRLKVSVLLSLRLSKALTICFIPILTPLWAAWGATSGLTPSSISCWVIVSIIFLTSGLSLLLFKAFSNTLGEVLKRRKVLLLAIPTARSLIVGSKDLASLTASSKSLLVILSSSSIIALTAISLGSSLCCLVWVWETPLRGVCSPVEELSLLDCWLLLTSAAVLLIAFACSSLTCLPLTTTRLASSSFCLRFCLSSSIVALIELLKSSVLKYPILSISRDSFNLGTLLRRISCHALSKSSCSLIQFSTWVAASDILIIVR